MINNINVYHNSQLEEYRYPFGAVKTGTSVRIRIKIENCEPKEVLLRCWGKDLSSGENKESIFSMTRLASDKIKSGAGDGIFYEVTVKTPDVPSLFWYYFIINTENESLYYSNNKKLGGEGELTGFPTECSYQITVYDKSFKTPEWFCDSVTAGI